LCGRFSSSAWADATRFGDEYEPCGQKNCTVEIVDCVGALTAAWDRRLNNAYRKLMGETEPSSRERLRAAQRLWIQYRDANCAWYGGGEGTIARIEAAECLRSMTASRSMELEEEAEPNR
jgi:uncharacterized protein YecT (DUF1311 family)